MSKHIRSPNSSTDYPANLTSLTIQLFVQLDAADIYVETSTKTPSDSLHLLCATVLQSTNYFKLVPANWNCHYCSPCTIVCRKLIMVNIMKTNARMGEHLMRQSSGELVLQSRLTKRRNLSVKVPLGKEKALIIVVVVFRLMQNFGIK